MEWCDERNDKRCWTRNKNATVAMTFYSLAVIAMGLFGVLAELGAAFADRPAGYLVGVGIITLATSRNTGIVAGGLAVFVGLMQVLVGIVTGETRPPCSISGLVVPTWYIVFVRGLTFAVMLGVTAVGAICLYSAAKEDDKGSLDDRSLKWCAVEDNYDCWLRADSTSFALGAYGITLVLGGVFGIVGSLNMWHRLSSLRRTTAIGTYTLAAGGLCLGAAGNSGIVVALGAVCAGLQSLAIGTVFDTVEDTAEYTFMLK